MHRHLTSLLFIPLLFVSCQKPQSATSTTPPAADPAAGLKAAYALCGQYDDFAAAAPLAYQLAVAAPAEAGKWKEELAKIHFATGRHASCLKIVGDLIANHGGADKLAVLEMAALCNESLGHKPEASALWQAVWSKAPGAVRAVRLAGLQFELGKLDDAEQTLTAGLAAADALTATIPLPKTREEMQKIPAAAALHNLKALILIKRDPSAKEAAKKELEAALQLAPDYEIAKRNLDGL